MTELQTTQTTTLLQRGIAAARAGRSQEARQLLQQVVALDPDNEMAWLWLSGLMATNEQKRTCLERVLLANPDNTYARAGLERLQFASPSGAAADETDIIKARLATVTGGCASKPPAEDLVMQANPTIEPVVKRFEPFSSFTDPEKRQEKVTEAMAESTQPSPPATWMPSASDSFETTCPVCDEPVSPVTRRCPRCFTPFNLEQLLARDKQALPPDSAQSLRTRRGGILGFLGAIIAS